MLQDPQFFHVKKFLPRKWIMLFWNALWICKIQMRLHHMEVRVFIILHDIARYMVMIAVPRLG